MRTGQDNHILMIDDDASLVGITAIKLKHSGYEVDTTTSSTQGLQLASEQKYDALILDVTMPELTGFDVCKALRATGILTPILMLSGKTEKLNIVRSLELGADDYLTKPFNHNELVARLRALVRRNRRAFTARTIEKHGLLLDTESCKVTYEGRTTTLTRKEVSLLKRLMYESPEPVDRASLLKDVWEIDDSHTSNRLDVYVRRVRAKLEQIGAEGLIHTMRGNGYYFGYTHPS